MLLITVMPLTNSDSHLKTTHSFFPSFFASSQLQKVSFISKLCVTYTSSCIAKQSIVVFPRNAFSYQILDMVAQVTLVIVIFVVIGHASSYEFVCVCVWFGALILISYNICLNVLKANEHWCQSDACRAQVGLTDVGDQVQWIRALSRITMHGDCMYFACYCYSDRIDWHTTRTRLITTIQRQNKRQRKMLYDKNNHIILRE